MVLLATRMNLFLCWCASRTLPIRKKQVKRGWRGFCRIVASAATYHRFGVSQRWQDIWDIYKIFNLRCKIFFSDAEVRMNRILGFSTSIKVPVLSWAVFRSLKRSIGHPCRAGPQQRPGHVHYLRIDLQS